MHSSHLLSLAVGAGLAYVGPAVYGMASSTLTELAAPLMDLFVSTQNIDSSVAYDCPDHGYRTQIVSLDPLLIYIHNFVVPPEAALVVEAGKAALQPSPVTGYGGDSASQARTSWSAPLSSADAAVACVLERGRAFLGNALGKDDDMGAAQLVHYDGGQKFDLHHDWFRQPRITDADAAAGRRRLYNRVATFFVVLQANCTGGETYFPGVTDRSGESEDKAWRRYKDGLAFRPIPGNALFWVNLLSNGTGDRRTLHAGLPVVEGTKTAMNIWPRSYFGPDASEGDWLRNGGDEL